MILKTSGILHEAGNAPTLRGSLACIGGLLAVALLLAGSQADAQRAHFRYVGGRWSHASHAGWNRYWGGPSIGFYYAPTPVYLVPGYAAPSYYGGSSFWTSNPSFGISLNLGGGGYYGGGGYSGGGRNYHGGGHNYQSGSSYHGSSYHGNRPSGVGGHSSGGNHSSGGGGHSSGGGGHSSGGGRGRK